MKALASIKQDMEFNKNLAALIETLKSIAVAQYRMLEKKLETFEDIFSAIKTFLKLIDVKMIKHPFLTPVNKEEIVVAVTSDAGFLGGLNIQVMNIAVNEIRKNSGKLVVIGERGKMYVRGLGIPSTYFPGINDQERYAQAMQLRDYIVKKFLANSFGYLKVVYPKPISFTVQRVEMVSLLPYSIQYLHQQGKMSDIIMESTPQDMAEYLISLWMGQRFYDIFGASRLAEFSARYIHLEESVHKLEEIEKKVKLEYFHVRHEIVDRTMRELFSGRLLYGAR